MSECTAHYTVYLFGAASVALGPGVTWHGFVC